MLLSSRNDERDRRDLDEGEVEAARAQVHQRARGAVVEQRRQRDHERLRRERPRRDDVEVLPCVVEDDLRVEQRIDDPVELRHAGRGQQPVEDAAEADQADAVLVLEVVLDERGRGAHGAVERGLVLTARLRERVEEEDDVGVALGVKLVHPQLAAPRARPPVDPPDAVSGHELTQVGELDSLALLARDQVPGEDLRLERAQELLDHLGTGIDLERKLEVEAALVAEDAEAVVRDQPHRAEDVRAPALAGEAVLELALSARNPQGDGVLAVRERQALGHRQPQVELLDRDGGRDPKRERQLLALDRALPLELERELRIGRLGQREPRPGDQRERRREHDKLRKAEDERGDEAEGRQSGIRPELGGGSARQLNGGRLRPAASAPSPAPAARRRPS